MKTELRRVRLSDVPALSALFDSVFRLRAKDKEALVRWKYFHPYCTGSVQYAAFAGGVPVSHYANIPVGIRFGDRVMPAGLCTDMMTLSQYRGQGYISRLSKRAYADLRKTDAVMSLGFSNPSGLAVDLNSVSYGYRVVGRFCSYGLMAAFAGTKRLSAVPVTAVEDSPYRIPDGMYSIEKSRPYLSWRYADHPGNQYTVVSVRDGNGVIGHAVMRFSAGRADITDIALRDMDWRLVRDAIALLRQLAFARGRQIVVLSVLENEYWHRVLARTVVWKRSSHPAYYLTVRLHRDAGALPGIFAKDRWICVAGDIL